MTGHGLKSKLEWSRCHENRDYAPIDAPLTFEKLSIKPLEFQDPYPFRNKNSGPFQTCQDQTHPRLFGCRFEICARFIKSPRHPSNQRGSNFFEFFSLLGFYTCFSPFQTQKKEKKNTQKHPKTYQSFLILLSSPKTQGIILIPNLLFLGSTLWIWGLRVWMQLFSYHTYP